MSVLFSLSNNVLPYNRVCDKEDLVNSSSLQSILFKVLRRVYRSSLNEGQNYWWKKLEPAQKALTRAFTKIKEGNMNILTCWPTGRTVLLPKTKNLQDEKNYRHITRLNTS